MDFDKCTESLSEKLIVVRENKSTFIIDNKKRRKVKKVLVDGCLITGNRQRCDYLFEISEPSEIVYYVELKGTDIEKAGRQLGATLGYCIQYHRGKKRVCYIVASRVPRSGTKIQVLKKSIHEKP